MARTKKTSIYVLKLINGIDIIGTCYDTEIKSLSNTRSSGTCISIKNPLNIVTAVSDSGHSIIYLQRYMYGLDKEVEINKSMIITAYNANNVLAEYYNAGSEYQSEVLDRVLDIELSDMTETIKQATQYISNRDIESHIKNKFFSNRRTEKAKSKAKYEVKERIRDDDIFENLQDEWSSRSKKDKKVH